MMKRKLIFCRCPKKLLRLKNTSITALCQSSFQAVANIYEKVDKIGYRQSVRISSKSVVQFFVCDWLRTNVSIKSSTPKLTLTNLT